MSPEELASVRSVRGITPRGENFVTQDRAYIEQLAAAPPGASTTTSCASRSGPGTTDAMIDDGATSRSAPDRQRPALLGPAADRQRATRPTCTSRARERRSTTVCGATARTSSTRGSRASDERRLPASSTSACARGRRHRRARPSGSKAQSGLEPCIAEGLRATASAVTGRLRALRHRGPAPPVALVHRDAVRGARRAPRGRQQRGHRRRAQRGSGPGRRAVPARARSSGCPSSDEFGQQPRKVVWALQRIGTPEALAAIRDEVTPDLPENVVEAAERALENR